MNILQCLLTNPYSLFEEILQQHGHRSVSIKESLLGVPMTNKYQAIAKRFISIFFKCLKLICTIYPIYGYIIVKICNKEYSFLQIQYLFIR